MSELLTFARSLAAETKDAIAAAVAPLHASIAELKTENAALRASLATIRNGEKGEKGDPGRDGRDAEPPDVAIIAQRAADLIPRPRDGRDADPLSIKGAIATELAGYNVTGLVRDEVARMFATITVPKDGRDGKDADLTAVKAMVAGLMAEWRPSVDALSVKALVQESIPDVAGIVRESVSAALSNIAPRDGRDGINGKDGASVTTDDVMPILSQLVDRAVSARPVPKDGIGVKGTVIDRDGHLVMTLTDGTTMDSGLVIGRDGKDGAPGEKGEKGESGRDGVDGLGLDDAELLFDEKSGFVLRLKNDTRVKDLALPLPFYVDVFRMGEKYVKGSIVTHRGLWLAMADTRERPGDGATSWKLIVKNGRDGRDRIPEPE